jgi:hypothetical protein
MGVAGSSGAELRARGAGAAARTCRLDQAEGHHLFDAASGGTAQLTGANGNVTASSCVKARGASNILNVC